MKVLIANDKNIFGMCVLIMCVLICGMLFYYYTQMSFVKQGNMSLMDSNSQIQNMFMSDTCLEFRETVTNTETNLYLL